MKVNYIGIVAGILAFVSIALPWWTLSFSASVAGVTIPIPYDISIYPYGSNIGALAATFNLWYAWAALAFMVIGGILAIVGSVTSPGRKLIIGGAVLALLAIIIFAVGLMYDLPNALPILSGVNLFSSGSYAVPLTTMTLNWSTYLSYGFWLALVAMILAFVAYPMHPKEGAPPPPAPA